MEKARMHHKKGERGFLQAVLLSLAITAAMLLVLLVIISAILMKTSNPLALIPACGSGSALFSALFCGFVSARLRGRQGLLVGAAAGLGYVLLFLLAGTVLVGDGVLEIGMLLFSSLIFFVLAILGGVLGSMERRPRRRRRKRS